VRKKKKTSLNIHSLLKIYTYFSKKNTFEHKLQLKKIKKSEK